MASSSTSRNIGNSPASSFRRVSLRLVDRTRSCTARPHIRITRNPLYWIIDRLNRVYASVSLSQVDRKTCLFSIKSILIGFAAQVRKLVVFQSLSWNWQGMVMFVLLEFSDYASRQSSSTKPTSESKLPFSWTQGRPTGSRSFSSRLKSSEFVKTVCGTISVPWKGWPSQRYPHASWKRA